MVSNGATSFELGILNIFRTGNPVLDMGLALLLPVAGKMAYELFMIIQDSLTTFIARLSSKRYAIRNITLRKEGREELDDECYNSRLQRAICMYIDSLKLIINTANTDLIWSDDDYCADKYRVLNTPTEDQWFRIIEEHVEIFIEEDVDNQSPDNPKGGRGGQPKNAVTTKILRIRSKTSEECDKFISKAYDWYTNYCKQINSDTTRYMFTPINFGDKPTFSEHALSDNKTLNVVFFPFKKSLLQLLDDFTNKKGKYSIPGVKQQVSETTKESETNKVLTTTNKKLGLLLHGPPGTGKTSLIKAISNQLKRHIVTVPLSRITTNRELLTLFFDLRFSIPKNHHTPSRKYEFKDLIFVLEDIDAASDVVKKRQNDIESKQALITSAMKNISDNKSEESSEKKMKNFVEDDVEEDDNKQQQKGKKSQMEKLLEKFAELDDALNLSGVLNAIDGIVDAPDRVIIMTSNHPEKLDPALIRPGRVDRSLLLDYLQPNEAVEMTCHYFRLSSLPIDIETRIRKVFMNNNNNSPRTPAEIEQIAIIHETLESFVQALENGEGWHTMSQFYGNEIMKKRKEEFQNENSLLIIPDLATNGA